MGMLGWAITFLIIAIIAATFRIRWCRGARGANCEDTFLFICCFVRDFFNYGLDTPAQNPLRRKFV